MSGGIRRVGSTAARLARLPYHRRVCRAEFHFPEPPPVTGEAVTGPSVQEWVERAQGDFLDNLDLDGSTTIACGRLGFRLRRSTSR